MAKYILYIHIISGFTAFLSAPLAMLSNKDASVHRKFGNVFFYAMTLVFITAMALSVMTSNVFLFLIGFFSYSFVWNGKRSIKIMKNRQPLAIDQWVNGTMIVLNSALLIYPLYIGLNKGFNTFAILALVFGSVGLITGVNRYLKFKKGLTSKLWLAEHITSMGGGYIAAVTAFSATNLIFLPEIVAWIWPTIIGSTILTVYMRKFRKKYSLF